MADSEILSIELDEEVASISERVIYNLLGKRWVPGMHAVEEHTMASDQRFVELEGRPVIEIESVQTPGGVDVDYRQESGYRLRILPEPRGQYRLFDLGGPWCPGPRTVVVTYTYGTLEPPAMVTFAIQTYAEELTKAITGDSTCRLPKRITSISRQGISFSLLDPGDYLDAGKTGLPDVDAMIRVLNPSRARVPARVYGKRTPPPVRLSTERLV